jgi:hypothetical protein
VAGVAAVALIAVPLTLAANGSDRSGPDPANPSSGTPTTVVGWQQEIPAGFPLTEGMPATNGHDGSPVTAHPGYDPQAPVAPCGSQMWEPDTLVPASDVEQAIYTGETEGGEERTLALYADDEAAREALDAIRTPLAEPCTVPRTGIASQEVGSDLGEESIVYVDRYRDGGEFTGEAFLHQVVRTGNALLLVSTYFGGGGDDAVVAHTAQLVRTKTAVTVSSMCVFAAEPCSLGTASPASPSEGAGEGAVSAIPAGFPLLDGYPEDSESEGGDNGRQGPSSTLEPIVPEACGSSVPVPDHVELLRAGWTNPEDYRERQLVTFATTDDALAYEDAILETYARCTREDTSDGYTRVTTVLDTGIGESSGVAVTHYELDGNPAIGLATVHVVRAGRAVLVSTISNEGGGGPDPTQQAQEAAAESEAQLAGVVPAMCLFTEDGC